MKFPLRNHEKPRKCATHTCAHTHVHTQWCATTGPECSQKPVFTCQGFCKPAVKHRHCEKLNYISLQLHFLKDKGNKYIPS